jgi:serine/threonine protein kinase
MAEMIPPRFSEPPMTVIFSIPSVPPPTLKSPDSFSKEFNDFIAACLTKDPRQRPSTEELIQLPFFQDNVDEEVMKQFAQVCSFILFLT